MPTDSGPWPPPNTSNPPGGLVVLPSGLVVYEFEGTISALGVFLPEGNFATPEDQNKVIWRDVAQLIHSYIFGAVNVAGTGTLLEIVANATNRRNEGRIDLEVQDSEGRAATLTVDSRHEPGIPQAYIGGLAAGLPIVIWKVGLEEEESDFWQVAAGTRRAKLDAAGNVTAEWTGEEFRSQVVTVNHTLGAIPKSVQLTPQTSEASTVPVTARLIEGSKTATQFKFMLQAPVKVVAGTKVKVDWAAFS